MTEKVLSTPSTPGLRKLALTGSMWTLGGYGLSQVLRLGSHLILAWLLAPEIFGLMALVKVVMQGLNMFSDVGIQPSIVQSKRGEDQDFLDTAWTIQLARGIVLWLLACMLAWPAAQWYSANDPAALRLVYLIPVAGLVAVVDGLRSPALALLSRRLQVRTLTLIEVGKQVTSLAIMIVWALISPTVWAMVAGGIAGSLFQAIVSHVCLSRRVPRLRLDRDSASELYRFGRWIFLSTVCTFLAGNLDKIILGRVLTLAELGLYSIGFVFARVPLRVTMRLGQKVLFPVYSRYRDNPVGMVQTALRAREPVLYLGAAVCICTAVGSRLFFETLWDPRYATAGFTVRWMAIYIWAMIMLLTMDRIPLALGNSRAVFMSNLLQCSGIVFAVFGYRAAGLPGFLCGLTLGPILSQFLMLTYMPAGFRWRMFRQGAVLSLLGCSYAVPAVLLSDYVAATQPFLTWVAVVAALVLIPAAVAMHRVIQRVRGGARQPDGLTAVRGELST